MNKRLDIILPGKIGDIVICLPIAKYLSDKGFDIHWALWPGILPHFNKGHFPYVTFREIPWNDHSINNTIKYCKSKGYDILDLSFTSMGSWNNNNTKKFRSQTKYSFDEFRYNLANVPFDEKWKLDIKRDGKREVDLFNSLITQKYACINLQGSDTRRDIPLDNRDNLQIIHVSGLTDCIFDWLLILERAEFLVCIDSAIANIVEQLNMKNKKWFALRSNNQCTPILQNEWSIIK